MSLSRQHLYRSLNLLAPLCGDFEFSISQPATEKQVAWRQKQIGRTIPEGITRFALQTASRFSIQWRLDANLLADVEFESDVPCSGEFQFNFYETNLSDLEGWEESFTNWQQYQEKPNLFGFHDLFPAFSTATGDLIVIVTGATDTGALYYLDHENGEGDWKRLADSYDQFLSTLADLWFPSLEWDGSLELFHDADHGRLSSECGPARELNQYIQNQTASRHPHA